MLCEAFLLTHMPHALPARRYLIHAGSSGAEVAPLTRGLTSQVSPGGIVNDPAVHQEVIARVTAGAAELGFVRQGLIESPIRGAASGNAEFLGHFVRLDGSCTEQPTSAVAEADAQSVQHGQ